MINRDVNYLSWLMSIVCDEDHQNYENLLLHLHNTDFYSVVKRDDNRAEDGVHLRSVFQDQVGYYPNDFGLFRGYDDPCSVLEMMVALSVRCSEDILWDGENNWTPFIFWSMVENLGLLDMDDSNWNEYIFETKIGLFLERKYENDGSGSLFKLDPNLSQIPNNFKKLEIWYQMQHWISEKFE